MNRPGGYAPAPVPASKMPRRKQLKYNDLRSWSPIESWWRRRESNWRSKLLILQANVKIEGPVHCQNYGHLSRIQLAALGRRGTF